MVNTKTQGGNPAFRINLQTIVTLTDFSRALGEHKFNLHGDFDFSTLKKKAAKTILFHRLRYHGRHGSYEGLENLGETTDQYNEYIAEAKAWVSKNYPYLLTK